MQHHFCKIRACYCVKLWVFLPPCSTVCNCVNLQQHIYSFYSCRAFQWLPIFLAACDSAAANIPVHALGHCMYVFLMGTTYLRVKLLGHRVCVCSALLNSFSKWSYEFTLLPTVCERSLGYTPGQVLIFLFLFILTLLLAVLQFTLIQ